MQIKDLKGANVQNVVRSILKGCMNGGAIEFLISQIRCGQQKPKGRRWSLYDKAVALSLYKRSPKGYRLLQSITALPSRNTLLAVLKQIPLYPGICTKILEHLAEYVHKMPERDQQCALVFDEMSLRQNLEYDHSNDLIYGYEDFGDARDPKYANTALVFLLQGIRRQWKQPIAFYFVHSKMASSRSSIHSLDKCIKNVLDACNSVKLDIVATICDMGTNNVSALEALGATYDNPFFSHNGRLIYRFFDPPHLLKCTRNLFFKHRVKCTIEIGGNCVEGEVDATHIRQAIEEDKKNIFRTVPKITEAHLNPNSL